MFTLLDEVNFLKKQLKNQNEKYFSGLIDSKIEESKKEINIKVEEKINKKIEDAIKDFIRNMTSVPFFYGDYNKEQINELVNKNGKEFFLEEKEKNKNSIFCNIYNEKKRILKINLEQILINETEKDFQKLKEIFEDKGLNSLDENILQIYLRTIKGKNKEEILKEIDALNALFKINPSEEKKDMIVDSLFYLSNKEDIINISHSFLLFIDKSNLSKGNLWKVVNEIQQNKEKLNNTKELINYFDNLKKNNFDIDILYDKNYEYNNCLNIILNIKENPEVISFLLGKTENHFIYLQEIVKDDGYNILNLVDIDYFRNCVIFMKNIGYTKEMKDYDFFKSFKENVKKTKDIQIYLARYVNIYNELNKLFTENFDKSASSTNKIISICKNSVFILKNKQHNFFKGYYYERMQKVFIKLPALKELRDLVLLTKLEKNDIEKNTNLEKFQIFLENINSILKI